MIDRTVEARKALEIKPRMGQPCNHCGWCCLSETCQVGQAYTPYGAQCVMLVPKDDKYFCKLGVSKEMRNILSMGEGCDAISIEEKLAELAA